MQLQTKIRIRNFGRGFAGHEDFYRTDVACWQEAYDLLREFTFPNEDGSKTVVTLDWAPIVEEVQRACRRETLDLQEAETMEISRLRELLSGPTGRTAIQCKVVSPLSAKDLDVGRMITRCLYESFLAMNLASPGSFNVFSCQLAVKSAYHFAPSGYFFEDAWHISRDEGWPLVASLPLASVLNYIRSLKIAEITFAKNRIDRAIYSLLHACLRPAGDPTTLIWLAYCLESLFETPIGQAFSVLFKRISRVLSIPAEKAKEMKRLLRAFYDERHKFAHGHAPVVHPMQDHEFNSEADSYMYSVQNATSFAFAVALSSIQLCINNNWTGFDFVECWNGIPAQGSMGTSDD